MWNVAVTLSLVFSSFISVKAGIVTSMLQDDYLGVPDDGQNNNEIWGGSCGLPPLPARQLAVRLVREEWKHLNEHLIDDIFYIHHGRRDSSWVPWLIRIWFQPPPNSDQYGANRDQYGGFYDGAATLIRAKRGHDQSDIAITSAHNCIMITRYQAQGYTVEAVFGVHGMQKDGYKRIPISSCVPHTHWGTGPPYRTVSTPAEHPAEYNIGVMKFGGFITFTHGIRPVCMPNPDETISDGATGIIADWGNTGNDLNLVLLRTKDYYSCSALVNRAVCVGGNNASTSSYSRSAVGGPFLTLRVNEMRFVLSGIVSPSDQNITSDNVRLPTLMADVHEYATEKWLPETIKKISQLWPQRG